MASFGENLKRERELRGIELRDIAEATKISLRFLEALEADRFAVLPGGIFRRSFVREYARYVGLDADRLVAEFLHSDVEERVPAAHPAKKPGYRRLFFGLSVFAALGAAFSSISTPDAAAPEAALAAPAPVFPGDRLLPAISSAADAGVGDTGPLVLTLRASESCWVGVQVDGHIVLDRVMGGGESQTLQATDEIVLSVGNAGGVSVRINDRPGLALGRRGEVRRNIVITRQNLPSLVEDVTPGRSSHSG
jgi:cytoskeletal protein RodZ